MKKTSSSPKQLREIGLLIRCSARESVDGDNEDVSYGGRTDSTVETNKHVSLGPPGSNASEIKTYQTKWQRASGLRGSGINSSQNGYK